MVCEVSACRPDRNEGSDRGIVIRGVPPSTAPRHRARVAQVAAPQAAQRVGDPPAPEMEGLLGLLGGGFSQSLGPAYSRVGGTMAALGRALSDFGDALGAFQAVGGRGVGGVRARVEEVDGGGRGEGSGM